jgi:hypothetical protein
MPRPYPARCRGELFALFALFALSAARRNGT